ncbi:phosphoribosylglycinamide formyltransferase [Spirochaetia bacterium]|nr:phosphoribosylglycinamide formyltransferase [Spirochaetia bacterium]
MSAVVPKRVAVLVSGGGTNLQALLDAASRGLMPHADIVLVVSSCKDAFAIERAKKANVKTEVLDTSQYFGVNAYDNALLPVLLENKIDIVVLAGFLVIIGKKVLGAYKDRIINVHPSLIPSFCGDGYYGLFVHEAALKRGVKVTGATVHLVNEITDGGKILLQKSVGIKENDTPEILQRRVMEQAEWIILPEALELICKEEVRSYE